jgi:hypothetical protein
MRPAPPTSSRGSASAAAATGRDLQLLCESLGGCAALESIGVHTCRDPATGALPAGSRLISFAPNNGSTPTTSTTTTNNQNKQKLDGNLQEGALLLGLPPLKLEGGVGQEEVLSSLTLVGSGRNPVATPGPDQEDILRF